MTDYYHAPRLSLVEAMIYTGYDRVAMIDLLRAWRLPLKHISRERLDWRLAHEERPQTPVDRFLKGWTQWPTDVCCAAS